jgi:hypothetical protein
MPAAANGWSCRIPCFEAGSFENRHFNFMRGDLERVLWARSW